MKSSFHICLIILCFVFSEFTYSQSVIETDNNPDSLNNSGRHLLIGIGAGYRFDIDSSPEINSVGCWGFSVDIPITENLSLSSGLGFWSTPVKYGLIMRDYSIMDIPFLLTYTSDMKGKGLDLFIGSGFLKASDQGDKLVTLNFGSAGWYKLSKTVIFIIGLKFQKAVSLQAGGGDSFTSLYLSSGIKLQIN